MLTVGSRVTVKADDSKTVFKVVRVHDLFDRKRVVLAGRGGERVAFDADEVEEVPSK